MTFGAPQIVGKKPGNYAGDVTVEEAWRILGSDQYACLVDVRTEAEWSYVGVPDLSEIGRNVICLEWMCYPDGVRNPHFESSLEHHLRQYYSEELNRDACHTAGDDDVKTHPLLMLCRSGQRSREAARAMSAQGYSLCFNVLGGFEGELDQNRQRGRRNGWQAAGLAWFQS